MVAAVVADVGATGARRNIDRAGDEGRERAGEIGRAEPVGRERRVGERGGHVDGARSVQRREAAERRGGSVMMNRGRVVVRRQRLRNRARRVVGQVGRGPGSQGRRGRGGRRGAEAHPAGLDGAHREGEGLDRVAQIAHRVEAVLREGRHRLVDRGGELGREPGREVLDARDLAGEVRGGDLLRIVPADRAAAGEHLEHHHAEREDVGARVDSVGRVRLLRRHVLGRAHDHARPREALLQLPGDLELGDAEVEQLEQRRALGPGGDHHVVGLEIAVHDRGFVRGLDALDHLHRVLERVRVREALPGLVEIFVERLQRPPLEVLEHDEGQAVRRLIHVHDADHVRALDLGGDLGLLEEALDEAGAARELGVEELERHERAQHLVAGLVDRAHAAVADQAIQAVLVVDD